jgi:hypothetical protein
VKCATVVAHALKSVPFWYWSNFSHSKSAVC